MKRHTLINNACQFTGNKINLGNLAGIGGSRLFQDDRQNILGNCKFVQLTISNASLQEDY